MSEVLKLLALEGQHRIDVHAEYEAAYRGACACGHTDVVKVLLALEGDRRIHVQAHNDATFSRALRYEFVDLMWVLLALEGDRLMNMRTTADRDFRWACANGRVEAAKVFLALNGDRRIDVHSGQDYAFKQACMRGHSGVVRLLLGLHGDRCIDAATCDFGFRCACMNGSVGVLRLLLALEGSRRIDVHAHEDDAVQIACLSTHTCRAQVLKVLLELRGDRRFSALACNNGFRFACMQEDSAVVGELLAVDGDRVPSHEAQRSNLELCMAATKLWTQSVCAWRRAGVCLTALHAELRSVVTKKARALMWTHREKLLLAHPHARELALSRR